MIDTLKFSQLLKDKSIASEEEIKIWMQEAQKLNMSLLDYLYLTRPIQPTQVLSVLADFYKLPQKVFEVGERIPKEILEILPEESAKNFKCVVFDKNSEGIYVGAVDPDVSRLKETIDFLGKRLSLKVKLFLISPLDFYRVVSQYHSFDEEIKRAVDAFQKIKLNQPARKGGTLSLDFMESGNREDAPIIGLVSAVIRQAVIEQASDIHFEPMETSYRIRFRMEGELKTTVELPKELGDSISTRLKVMAQLKLDENRIPQDGRIQAFIEGREIDFRVASLPTPNGESIAIRILDPLTGLKKLSDLGLYSYHVALLDKVSTRPYGLIVIAGPTGSGKTTTLYAILQKLNQETENIIALEDPIEYRMRGINQSQVKPEIGYTFASGLRQILRQDPNIILVGEVRDEETAELVTHAALTGHLVFTTIHANDATAVIPRLLDLKVRRFLLPSTLVLMLSQRLAPKLCQFCHVKEEASAPIEKEIDSALIGIPQNVIAEFKVKKPYFIYKPKGCDKCNGRGFKGRMGIFEAIEMDAEIGKVILDEKDVSDIKAIAQKRGTVFLRQDGVIKALQGFMTIEEVFRETV